MPKAIVQNIYVKIKLLQALFKVKDADLFKLAVHVLQGEDETGVPIVQQVHIHHNLVPFKSNQ